LKKRLLQRLEQENSHCLDTDTNFSALVAGCVTITITTGLVLLSQQPLTLASGYHYFINGLMLFAFVFLLLMAVSYGRYRSSRTFWEYLLSLKRVPPTHWTTPQKLNTADTALAEIDARRLFLLTKRGCPHHRPKHKAPILLFQQASLLLAP
jgi:hypothetical protein